MEARIRQPSLRALVIGYGNPLRGDDALGPAVAYALAAIPEIAVDPLIRIETVHQLTPELAEPIADAERVLFIDATAPSPYTTAGSLCFDEIEPVADSTEALGHHMTPARVLAYANALYGATPKAFVVSVTAASFDYGAPLSPGVKAVIPALVQWAREYIGSALVPSQ